jgi:hypothetical protein
MKPIQQLLILLALTAATPTLAQDYAWQWPIKLDRADEPAYEIALDEAVYASLADPLLRDLAVLDGAGNPLPAAMQAPRESRVEGPAEITTVPWFLLPGDAGNTARVEVSSGRFESAGVALSWRAPEVADKVPDELLLDLGDDSRTVRAVQIEPAGDDAIWRARIEVLSSSDLQRWTPVAVPASLYRLVQDGHRLTLLRIPLDRAPERYLRLRHTGDSARGAISEVQVERREQPLVEAEPLRWIRLAATAGGSAQSWQYRLPGAMRIEAWNLQAGEGNWVLKAALSSRNAEKDSWQRRGDGERYQWRIDQEKVSSPPAGMGAVRDIHWQLTLAEPRADAPTLLLGYRPDRLLFLPETEPPYRLVAGSGSARRTDAPTRAVLAAIRQHRGKDWHPAEAALGPRSELAGTPALTPARSPVDWRTALLWAVLIGVAGSVVVIALKLLKQPEGEQG